MTKRKPSRRRSAKKTSSSIGPLWWGVGILAVGWIAFDGNRATVADYAPALATLFGGEPERAVQGRPQIASAPPARPESQRPAAAPAAQPRAARPETRVASVPRTTPPAEIVPAKRPEAARPAAPSTATPASATSRPTPLRREPEAGAPVWVTLEAGKPVRVTARQGAWRRVESGIFTGWVEAEFLERPVAAQTAEAAVRRPVAARPVASMPARPATDETPRPRPAPPGAIPR